MENSTQTPFGHQAEVSIPVRVKYCLYARKSTESDEKQALSIDSQVNEMLAVAKRDGLDVVDIRRESYSSKETGKRPVFNQMLEDVRSGKFNGLLTWAPDRLSRNAGDLGAIVDLLDKNVLLEVRTYGQTFSNNPNEKFLLMILGSQAKLENDQKGVNVKRGLRARCEMGLWPAPAPTGYLNYNQKDRKCEIFPDPNRASVIKQIFEKFVYENMSGRDLHFWLKKIEFTSINNKPLSLSNVYKVLSTPLYMGEFDYPRGSGVWYKGKNQPLISKELYMLAQEKMRSNRSVFRIKRNDFAFTRLMVCGLCGSGISAQEKTKSCKNGNVHKYVYYGCSKSKDRFCKNKYLEEGEVIKQILEIIDKLDLDQVNLGYKIQRELERYSHFQSKVLGISDVEMKKKKEVDIKNYAKYLLEEGTIVEKRELLENLKSKLVLKERFISLKEQK
jgi:site-specific DNA recombinase